MLSDGPDFSPAQAQAQPSATILPPMSPGGVSTSTTSSRPKAAPLLPFATFANAPSATAARPIMPTTHSVQPPAPAFSESERMVQPSFATRPTTPPPKSPKRSARGISPSPSGGVHFLEGMATTPKAAAAAAHAGPKFDPPPVLTLEATGSPTSPPTTSMAAPASQNPNYEPSPTSRSQQPFSGFAPPRVPGLPGISMDTSNVSGGAVAGGAGFLGGGTASAGSPTSGQHQQSPVSALRKVSKFAESGPTTINNEAGPSQSHSPTNLQIPGPSLNADKSTYETNSFALATARSRRLDSDASARRQMDENELPMHFVIEKLTTAARKINLTTELIIYIPFVVFFVFFFLWGSNIGDGFYITQSYRSSMVETMSLEIEFEKSFGNNFGRAADWTLWFETVAMRRLWNQDQPDTSYQYRYLLGQNLLFGAVRVRVQRVRNDSCTVNLDVFPQSWQHKKECYAEYTQEAEQRAPFGGPNNDYFKWVSMDDSPGIRTSGQAHSYHSGGFTLFFPFAQTYNNVSQSLQQALDYGLIDELATRFVIVEFFAYNVQFDTFISNKYYCEVAPSGYWASDVQIRQFRMWTEEYIWQTIIDCFFFAFVMYYILKLIWDIHASYAKTGNFTSFINVWSILETANMLCFVIVFAAKFEWFRKSRAAKQILFPYKANDYPGAMEDILNLYNLQIYVNAFNTVITFLKILKFFSVSDKLNILTRTVDVCQQNIFGILLIFIYLVLAFAFAGNVLFGQNLGDFRNLNWSYSSLMKLLMGSFDYMAMYNVNQNLAGVFFWAFILLGLFLLLNMIIAVVSDAFEKVNGEHPQTAYSKFRRPTLADLKRIFRCVRKGKGETLLKAVDVLEVSYRQQKHYFGETVAEDDIVLLFSPEKDRLCLLSVIPEKIVNSLEEEYLQYLWHEMQDEWSAMLELDEEKEKREEFALFRRKIRKAFNVHDKEIEEIRKRVDRVNNELKEIQQFCEREVAHGALAAMGLRSSRGPVGGGGGAAGPGPVYAGGSSSHGPMQGRAKPPALSGLGVGNIDLQKLRRD